MRCPLCGESSRHDVPEDACQWFLECPACGELLTPRRGDCCVFCSYGDVPCPPVQRARRGEASAGCCD
ncbi:MULTISPECIES: GDCCVxC domain-containing (seleno)protein [unclassified Guyparkeria]|uniref:GDCCVxC domain-containing (seleno)protein n=1 Tax=unclassified Guyparkeria TaxID=2626246 RepID=UPI001E4BD185|nr:MULTISPECIES: GDCCVxC domain-containing (seleno)protein [unclassified Guyparkeria]